MNLSNLNLFMNLSLVYSQKSLERVFHETFGCYVLQNTCDPIISAVCMSLCVCEDNLHPQSEVRKGVWREITFRSFTFFFLFSSHSSHFMPGSNLSNPIHNIKIQYP